MNIELTEKLYRRFISHRQTIEFLLKISIAISLLYFLISYISFQKILSAFKNADLIFIFYAGLLSIFNNGLQIVKWKLVLKNSIGQISYSNAAVSFFCGVSSGLSTPARLGEFVGRALPLKEHKFLDVTLTSFVDKLINVLVITFFGSIASILFYRSVNSPNFFIDVPLLAVVVILFATITYIIFSKGILITIVRNKFKENNKVLLKIFVVQKFLSSPTKNKLSIAFVNLFFYFIILFQFYLLLSAFYINVSFLDAILIASLILFTTTVVVPFSFGDIGVREGAATYLIVLVGIPAAVGFNAAFVLFILNVIIPSIVGLFFLMKNK